MDKECEVRLEKITKGFQECRSAFTAIGDETRQLDSAGTFRERPVGHPRWRNCRESPSDQAFRIAPSADIEVRRHCQHEKRGNQKLLLYQRR